MAKTSVDATHDNKWWTLLAVCIATFMLLLDVTIVNIALKSIQSDLHSTFSDLQWVVDAYALTLASFLLVFGSLADLFGRRRIFLFGIFLFSAASLSCALSTGPVMLNFSRAVQGIGGAAMFSTALALIAQEFQGKDRGTAFGIWGAVTGAGVAVGPLIGGALVDGFGWASIFFVNVPVGIATIALTYWKVSDSHGGQPGVKIDWIGFFSFSIALFLLIFGLVRGNIDGWTSSTILGALIGSAVLIAIFIIAELKLKNPMLDLSLFKVPTFIGASAAAVTLSGSIFALFLYITLYFQEVLLYKPFATGLRFLPTTLISFFIAAGAGKASATVSPKWLMGVGLGLVGTGLVLISALVQTDSSWLAILPGLCCCGFGIGLTNPPLASTAVGVVAPQKSGMASGINSTFRQIGIATGIAGLGAIFQHQIVSQVSSKLTGTFEPPDVSNIAHSVTAGTVTSVVHQFPYGAQHVALDAVKSGFVYSFDYITAVGAVIAFAGAIVVFLTVRKKDFLSGGLGQ